MDDLLDDIRRPSLSEGSCLAMYREEKVALCEQFLRQSSDCSLMRWRLAAPCLMSETVSLGKNDNIYENRGGTTGGKL